MRPFSYIQVESERGAVNMAAMRHNSAFIAGGTTLLDLMKLNVSAPESLVDINGLPLDRIEAHADGSMRIGALVRNSVMADDKAIRTRYPMLSQAILAGASPQLRNMATLGGNILQRTRCQYFRDTTLACNKRNPGSGCAAMDGCNRIHAVLGASNHCIATHPSDMCVALTALDAIIHTRGPGGERDIPFTTFHVVPGDRPDRENLLQPGELITSVTIPAVPFAVRSTYIKVRDRASFAFALASVAAAIDIQDGSIRDARLALGGIATKPWRCTDAEKALVGKRAEAAAYQRAAAIAVQGARPLKHNAFKVELAKRAIVRALTSLTDVS